MSITENQEHYNDFMTRFIEAVKGRDKNYAKQIPTLPKQIKLEHVQEAITTMESVPIGFNKNNVSIHKFNYKAYPASAICSKKIANTNNFLISLVETFKKIPI